MSIDKLFTLKESGINPSLDRIREALSLLGNPERDIKTIHVAGTNGKGSTCAFLSNILHSAGYKVGMFTSPHITKINERFQINNKQISDEELESLFEQVDNTNVNLSFFEYLTAMAFVYFKQVDYLVLEVGLGGLWDATNVATPLISIITNVDIDHTNYLGDSLNQIAKEKAGIIKRNSKVITTATGESLQIIKETASSNNAELIQPSPINYELSLRGEHQRYNATLAAEAAKQLGIAQEHITYGLKTTNWPGRLEHIGNILLDCSHNPAGVQSLSDYVKTLNYNKLFIIFGVMKDKDYNKMISLLPKADEIIYTKPNIERALNPNLLGKNVINSVNDAISYAKNKTTSTDLIIICGSIFTVAEARPLIKN